MCDPSKSVHPTPLRRAARPTRRAAPLFGRYPAETCRPNRRSAWSLGRVRAHLKRFPSKRRRSLHRRRSLFTQHRLVQEEDLASSLDDRLVEQLSVERDGPVSFGLAILECSDDTPRVGNLEIGRASCRESGDTGGWGDEKETGVW